MGENKRRAVVIEDDLNISQLLQFILQTQGYSVEMADDGDVALKLLDAQKEPPDLILMDLELPYLNGTMLIRHLRAKPGWKNVPVLMLTAQSSEEDIAQAIDAGASDYMLKPFEPMGLIRRIQRIMS